jgi:gluconate 2-dehydrogenase alpha chain
VPSALNSGRLEVREFSNAFRINHDGGSARSVSYYDASGQEQEQPADLIILTAFTLTNIRLLLLSQIRRPYDPQSASGAVGRNFTYQIGGASATGWYDDRILNRFMGSRANGYCIDEFSSDNFDHSQLGFFGAAISPATTRVRDRSSSSGRCQPVQPRGAAAGRRR